jgi:hypothetical protein
MPQTCAHLQKSLSPLTERQCSRTIPKPRAKTTHPATDLHKVWNKNARLQTLSIKANKMQKWRSIAKLPSTTASFLNHPPVDRRAASAA